MFRGASLGLRMFRFRFRPLESDGGLNLYIQKQDVSNQSFFGLRGQEPHVL